MTRAPRREGAQRLRTAGTLVAAACAALLAPAVHSPTADGSTQGRALVALASPDFDGDGFADLAVGVPNEGVGALGRAGAVAVLYGGSAGLSARDQLWTQDQPGVKDVAEAGDQFGASQAWGDFNGDGFADLAVSASDEDVGAVVDAGAVNVLYGSADGLTGAASQLWTQDTPGVLDRAETGDHFGYPLAAGDMNGDGFSDLLLGVFTEDVGAVTDAGAVAVLYGSSGGLVAAGNQLWTEDSPGVRDSSEEGDGFGHPVAAGDFDADGFADLAIGADGEDLGPLSDAGALHVLYGSATGVSAARSQEWTQDSPAVPDNAEAGDFFGHPLAAGDFDGDGRNDLVAGVSFEDVGAIPDAGLVNVFYGSAGGLSAARAETWSQNKPGVADAAEAGDRFGRWVAAADLDADGRGELLVAAANEDLGAVKDAGVLHVLPGTSAGVTSAGSQLWSQDSPGVLDSAEANDDFGHPLPVGDLDADGFNDLGVGVRLEDVGAVKDAGAVNVLYGSASGLTAAGSQLWTQDTPGVLDAAELGDGFGWNTAGGS